MSSHAVAACVDQNARLVAHGPAHVILKTVFTAPVPGPAGALKERRDPAHPGDLQRY